jgi:hypothetical protein
LQSCSRRSSRSSDKRRPAVKRSGKSGRPARKKAAKLCSARREVTSTTLHTQVCGGSSASCASYSRQSKSACPSSDDHSVFSPTTPVKREKESLYPCRTVTVSVLSPESGSTGSSGYCSAEGFSPLSDRRPTSSLFSSETMPRLYAHYHKHEDLLYSRLAPPESSVVHCSENRCSAQKEYSPLESLSRMEKLLDSTDLSEVKLHDGSSGTRQRALRERYVAETHESKDCYAVRTAPRHTSLQDDPDSPAEAALDLSLRDRKVY